MRKEREREKGGGKCERGREECERGRKKKRVVFEGGRGGECDREEEEGGV